MHNMEFSPKNNVVKLCLQGIGYEEQKEPDKALNLFVEAWNQATDEHEKFICAFFLARTSKNIADELKWLENALLFALNINDDRVNSALPDLYTNIAKCYEINNDLEKATEYQKLTSSISLMPTHKGPFYHGTRADLKVGELLVPGGRSNYQASLIMNHIYFTALVSGAGLAAEMAKADGDARVYIVEPTGEFENDPNVTNKKFPGNPTLSYRSGEPLKILGEITDWERQTANEIQKWRERLAKNKGEIIN